MKKIYTLLCLLFFLYNGTYAQNNVGIGTNTPNSSAKLDITDANKGLLIPRVSLTASNVAGPVTSPATSLLVYNDATAGTAPNNVTPGYYYWDVSKWVKIMVNNNNTIDVGYILGWTSNVAPPDYLLPLNGGTYNWADYPDFQTFHASYPCQFIASSTGATFTLKDINTSGRFLRGNTGAGIEQAASTAMPTIPFANSLAGAHTHSIDPPSTNTSTGGAHTHTITFNNDDFNGGGGGTNGLEDDGGGANTKTTASAGDHAHSLDIAAFNSASNGNHSHSISGGDAETRPINTSVIWCIKAKSTSTSGTLNITNTANTAVNGLSVYGSAIGLGGSLNQNTTILQTSFNLTHNLNGTGDFEIQDNGASAFFVRDDANVGIGTNTPTEKLTINGNASIPSTSTLEFGKNVAGKETNAGKIGYQTFTTGALDIIGAGTGSGNRIVKLWDNVIVNNLSGTGNRNVYAAADGTLKASSSVAYVQDRTSRVLNGTGAAVNWRTVGPSTTNLAVETNDIVTISTSFKFRWTGGSGGDHPFFGIRITGCATTQVQDVERLGIADDVPRNQYIPGAYNYVWVATCTGNVAFTLWADTEGDADDNAEFNDIVIVARKN